MKCGIRGKDGADGFAVAYAHVFEPIPRLAPEKAHWQELIDRCLAKDPKDRYANAEQVLAAIDAISVGRAAKNGEAAIKSVEAATAKPAAPATPARPEPAKPAAVSKPAAAKAAAAKRTDTSARSNSGSLWLGLAAIGVLGAAGLGGYIWWTTRTPLEPVTAATAAAPPPAATAPPPASVAAPVAQAPAPTVEAAPVETPPATTGIPVNAATSGTDAAIDSLAAVPAEISTEEAPPVPDAVATAPSGPTPLLMEDGEPGNPADVPTVEDPVQKLVRLARADLKAQRYAAPPDANALDRFRLALRITNKNS